MVLEETLVTVPVDDFGYYGVGENDAYLKFEKQSIFQQAYPLSSGLTLAHDLLEHVNGLEYIGSFEDEFQALGAMIFVRWSKLGYRRIDPEYALAQEIENNLCELGRELDPVEDISLPEGDFEDRVEATLRVVSASSERYRSSHMPVIRNYMRLGIVKAMERYRDCVCTYSLFEEVELVGQQIVDAVEWVGQRFKITVDTDQVLVNWEECDG